MNTSISTLPDNSHKKTENRARKVLARVCLAISITIHVVAIALILLASTRGDIGPKVTYIDINSIAESAAPDAPVIHSPSSQPEKTKAEEPVLMPEKPAEPAEVETPTPPVPPTAQEVRTTSLGRGIASGYFTSFAEGKNLRDDIREYYFVLLEKINHQWWLKAETLKETAAHDGVVIFVIGRDGALMEVQLSKSTGSREVDRAIVEVLKGASPFPPLPASYPLGGFRAPLKIAAPLHLFSIRSLR